MATYKKVMGKEKLGLFSCLSLIYVRFIYPTAEVFLHWQDSIQTYIEDHQSHPDSWTEQLLNSWTFYQEAINGRLANETTAFKSL